MRKPLVSLLAAAALAVPIAAQSQTRGLANGNIAFTYTGEVLPGQEAAFKQLVQQVIAAVQQEPGTLTYEWNMRADGKTFDVLELYQDSAAVVAHVKDVVAKFGEGLGKTQKELKLVVFGTPNDEAKQTLAGLHPEYETPFAGFMR
ncbi:MAG: antibiotic biosynthesis monooxygenase [Alphaproteobacteria bacterium]|nr:antibiotic biosynthesis monooxygenase [Alphaproteobacteria bacterium]